MDKPYEFTLKIDFPEPGTPAYRNLLDELVKAMGSKDARTCIYVDGERRALDDEGR